MPLNFVITDLWDWDIHFEEFLGDDWYFECAFGSPSSLASCADQLAEYFGEKCGEYGIDYDYSPSEPAFESLVREQAAEFIFTWRNNTLLGSAGSGFSAAAHRRA